ncbi:hypothetical protein HNR46_000297 [Haloferula luteola]|uniref:TIGR01777 family protein n=1 Tax=Haloferula luteola TaxID=595692 RepID=A0A840UZ21_9BACT|nr:TIGR01777 family oxidoreductase [Haloferula luteola]MBB5350076.1 hypothetical protein [Haloferula luteola]
MQGKRMGIVGAGGFIGGRLAARAQEKGWEVVGFSRRPRVSNGVVSEWRIWNEAPVLSGLDAVVNLAGEAIDQRWTDAHKQAFRSSRVGVTQTLVDALETCSERPEVLLNGSAVGIYGDRGEEILPESAVAGEGFLADLCRDWEAVAFRAAPCRVLVWRTGVVLGVGGAAWGKMKRVFSWGLGGNFGSGRQWMPWIHVEDLVGGMLHALEAGISGPVNGVAPEPVRNEELTRELAKVLGRPAILHAPAWALKVGLGEFASALLASQRAIPRALEESGYAFRFARLPEALEDLVGGA